MVYGIQSSTNMPNGLEESCKMDGVRVWYVPGMSHIGWGIYRKYGWSREIISSGMSLQ